MWKSSQRQLDSHIPTAPAATAAAPIFDLLAIVRPVLAYSGTVQRSACSRCSLPSVSRPADLPKLNLRGRYCATVPANGCLAKLLLWPYSKIAGWSAPFQRFGKPQVQGDLRLPLTSTYHGCPRFTCPRFIRCIRCVSSEDLSCDSPQEVVPPLKDARCQQ
jgi:hypothetical protein